MVGLGWWDWDDEKINEFTPLLCNNNIDQFIPASLYLDYWFYKIILYTMITDFQNINRSYIGMIIIGWFNVFFIYRRIFIMIIT